MERECDHTRIRKLLSKDYAGFVLVTCKLPLHDGQMEVEMSYEGDPILAAYLLDGAKQSLEGEEQEMLHQSQ
jgi:hypothetical protein